MSVDASAGYDIELVSRVLARALPGGSRYVVDRVK